MSKLLRQLRISGLATSENFEAANRRQQIYGGSFDTVLLELRILAPLALDEQLAMSSGLSTVPAQLLQPGQDRPWDAIAPALIDLGWAIPLSRSNGRVQVGVHPEIPDDQMDLLLDQPNLELMVTAECCLARVGSERLGSLTPQRYAILAASYVQGIGGGDIRAPTESAGAPWKVSSVARKSDRTLSGGPSASSSTLSAASGLPGGPEPTGPVMPPPSHGGAPPSWLPRTEPPPPAGPPEANSPNTTVARVTPVPRPAGAIERTPPPPSFSIPSSSGVFGGRSLSYASSTQRNETTTARTPPPPSFLPPSPSAPPPASVPPAPGSPRRMASSRSKPRIEVFDATDLQQRLEAARDRDAVTDILLAGATCLISRVVLLAVRKTGLKWLAASSRVDEPGQQVIALSETLHAAIHGKGSYDRCSDPDLRAAVGQDAAVPCALLPVEVAGRRVLAVYVDADGATMDDDDIESLRDLATWSGQALQRVVRGSAERKKQQPPVPRPASPAAGVNDDEGGDSITLKPVTATDRSDSGIPALVAGARAEPRPDPDAPTPAPLMPLSAMPPLARPPEPKGPAAVSGSISTTAPISARVPRLIDSAPPRSTTLISTSAPTKNPKRPMSAAGSLTTPVVRDLGAPVAPRSQPAAAPTAIPPVRTPVPPIRGSAAPVHEAPSRDGTLSPQRHQPQEAPPAEESAPSGFDDTMIPTKVPPIRGAAPPIRSGAPPVRKPPRPSASPTLRGQPRKAPALPSRSPTIPGTLPGVQPSTKRGIMTPLGTPLMQPPIGRGGLVLDEEDRHDDRGERSSEQIPREVLDHTIDAAMSDPTAIPALLELGEPALSRLATRFPGPLDVAKRDLSSLPPLSAHGPLIRLAVQLGQRISPMIRELLDHPDVTVRFYAAFTFQELRDEMVLDRLAKRAFDSDDDVRAIAMRVLETYSRSSAFSGRIAPIRQELGSENMTRQLHAARAVGTLRDVEAIPALMELLDHAEKRVRDIGLEGLCSITGQQLGSRTSRWRSWYEGNRAQHRVEWIIGALSHKDIVVRAWASVELRRITGQPYALPVEGSKREREQVIKQWLDWWARQGRSSFGVH